MIDEEGKVILQKDKPKKNENGYLGKPINPGYQSHFTLGIPFPLFFFFSFVFFFIKINSINEQTSWW